VVEVGDAGDAHGAPEAVGSVPRPADGNKTGGDDV
jgi:hypothetical protein